MIARDLDDTRALLIRQDDHADLASQFAAHWGNTSFPASDAADSLIQAAAYHDAHYRDIEASLPIDAAKGRPFGHRDLPFFQSHLHRLEENVEWLKKHDAYAALLVSMHHSGLPQNRYDAIRLAKSASDKPAQKRAIRDEVALSIETLEKGQSEAIKDHGAVGAWSKKAVWFHYRLLQLYDLLSLYFCYDGYGANGLEERWIGPVPISIETDEQTTLHLTPSSNGSVRIEPYPFDLRPLTVSVAARIVRRHPGGDIAQCRAEFPRAHREHLEWTLI
jgi:hypothetical protein